MPELNIGPSQLWQWMFRRDDTACIITSMVDFEEALQMIDDPACAKTLREGRNSSSVIDQIGAAIAARLILAKKMTDVELIRYVQHLQNRYSVAVGPSAYARYRQGIPADVFTDKTKLWAELQTLSYRLRLAYSITHLRDLHLARIRWVCFGLILISIVGLLALVGYVDFKWPSYPIINFIFVGTTGLIGALTSIARRANQILSTSPLEDDPIVQASALQQGAASLFVAGLTGPVFAVVILLIFMFNPIDLGILKSLVPTFGDIPNVHGDAPDFRIFDHQFWFNSSFDAAKLLLWAFVAGFLEQFVPDVLDRLAKFQDKKAPIDVDDPLTRAS